VICFGLVTSSTAEQLAPDPKTERFFVSPSGNDGWSGRLAAPNAAATDGPVATLAKARDLVRGLKAGGGLTKPVEVILRGGFYALSKPLEFAPADSGTEACPVTYRAYPGEKPVISGGRTLGPWQLVDGVNGKLWKMSLPDAKTGGTWQFNALFVNGERRVRARIPNKGSFLRTDGPTAKGDSRGFYFHKGDVQEWDNLRDVLFVAYHSWETSLHHVRDVDTEANIVTFREPAPWPMGRWERHQRYYVENVFEGLDEPGEWYLNRTTGTLHYYPRPGEKPDQVETVAPVVTSTLIRLAGDPEKGEYVEHLHFRGLSFQHTNADLRRIRNPGQGEIYQPAMIMAVGLRHSSIQGCEVAHTGLTPSGWPRAARTIGFSSATCMTSTAAACTSAADGASTKRSRCSASWWTTTSSTTAGTCSMAPTASGSVAVPTTGSRTTRSPTSTTPGSRAAGRGASSPARPTTTTWTTTTSITSATVRV